MIFQEKEKYDKKCYKYFNNYNPYQLNFKNISISTFSLRKYYTTFVEEMSIRGDLSNI